MTAEGKLLSRRELLRNGLAAAAGATALSAGALQWTRVAAEGYATSGTWEQLYRRNSPPPRSYASMASDLHHESIVLFGGSGVNSDTWLWNRGQWARLQPLAAPEPRCGASMAYDPVLHGVVLFGGLSKGQGLADTWFWDGSNWSELSPAVSPPARFGASFEYDPLSGSLILFGGATTDRGGRCDTWAWRESQWRQLSPTQSPPPLCGAVLAYDQTEGSLLLVGGWPIGMGVPAHPSMWLWSGTSWRHVTPSALLGTRAFAAVAPRVVSNALACFGGSTYGRWLGDTTLLTTTNASSLSGLTPPSPRAFSAAATDPISGDLILFGGQGAAGVLGDTWTLH
jgi:Galactose oxidase, central domain